MSTRSTMSPSEKGGGATRRPPDAEVLRSDYGDKPNDDANKQRLSTKPSLDAFSRFFQDGAGDEDLSQHGLVGLSKFDGRIDLKGRDVAKHEWTPFRREVSHFIEHPATEAFLAILVTVNAVLIIYETDLRAGGSEDPTWTTVMGYLFLGTYSLDVTSRIWCYRAEFFLHFMNNLDLFVVLADVISALLSSVFGELPSMSILRIMRIFRLTRFLHVLSMFKELHMLIHGFISASRAIIWASCMLGIMLTLWSIVAVEMIHPKIQEMVDAGEDFGGCERCPRAFASVMSANLTFIQQIVAGDSWGLVSVPLIEKDPWIGLILIGALISVNLGMLNLILTVIVNAAQTAHDEDTERRLKEKKKDCERSKKKLLVMCREIDTDNNGEITLEELLQGLEENRGFREVLAMMDVTQEDMTLIWRFLDKDGDGKLFYREFVEQLYRLKAQGTNTHLIFMTGHLTAVQSQVAAVMDFVKQQVMPAIDSVLGGIIHMGDAVAPVEHKLAMMSAWRVKTSQDIKVREQALHRELALQRKVPAAGFEDAGSDPPSPSDGPSMQTTRIKASVDSGAPTDDKPPAAPPPAPAVTASCAVQEACAAASSWGSAGGPPAADVTTGVSSLGQELAALRNRVEKDLAAQLRESTRRAEENARAQAAKMDALFKLVSQDRRITAGGGFCSVERGSSPDIVPPHYNLHQSGAFTCSGCQSPRRQLPASYS